MRLTLAPTEGSSLPSTESVFTLGLCARYIDQVDRPFLFERASAMSHLTIRYDEPSDTLHVAFAPGRGATGLELNENILLRVDPAERTAVGLTVFNYSLLAQRTPMGPRSFALTGMADLSDEMRDLALSLLLREPVSAFLTISAYSPDANLADAVPITSVQAERITAGAA
ncbi:DUF2283 domain-containing protein [Longimicrobium sp.]|uniref:DUF2283 domain-containing protein n=1 Tax=Longimicrobium sp. TaxID=2029185 RepID=UPI002E3822C8|nr:DUF2283 domain-containing protein [Longimicrobium sp.]HEX6038691.1 DUF2283 domain-containing protein [Longimicrobium sp.]